MKPGIGMADIPPEVATMDSSLAGAAAATMPQGDAAPVAPLPAPFTQPTRPIPPGVQLATPAALVPQAPTIQNVPEADLGLTFNQAAVAKLKVRRNFTVTRPPRSVTFRVFDVWGKGEHLGRVHRAVDESDAISQIVAALNITNTEQWMFQSRLVPEMGETTIPSVPTPQPM